jgi:hypothetical protein
MIVYSVLLIRGAENEMCKIPDERGQALINAEVRDMV